MVLFERYCAETVTSRERAQVEAWFAAHPEALGWSRMPEADIVRRAYEIMGAFGPMGVNAGVATQRASTRPADKKRIGVLGTQPLRRGMWSVVAALIVMAVGWLAGAHHVSARTASEMLTYTTGNGERATITLPDGGTVALNVASRLDVPMDYMAGNHTLRLVGEGLFTVPHHEGTPVTVVAGTTRARVLGTSFVVRQYATDTVTLVAVRDGKVAVGAAVVATQQVAEVGRTGVPHVRSSDASLFTFATGVLTIDGLPLPAAIVELDRWFDADIRLGDPRLATRFVKGKCAAGSLGDLAEILELTFNVRVVRDGRVLTLYPR